MPTYKEHLETRLAEVGRQLAGLRNNEGLDAPDASCPDPIAFTAKLKDLREEARWLREEIAECEGAWELPYEVDT